MTEQQFDTTKVTELPLASSVTDNDTILVVQGGVLKRVLPSLMRGPKGDNVYLRVSGDYIQYKTGEAGAWYNLIAVADLEGEDAFSLWKKIPGNENKTYNDYVSYNRQPAVEAAELAVRAATEVVQVSEAVSEAEGLRAIEESKRVTEESKRKTAEEGRVSEEGKRKTDESGRVTAETGRVSAETGRIAAEGNRVTEESKRKTAESGRVTAETGRVNAETSRVSVEAARVTEEGKRKTAETERVAEFNLIKNNPPKIQNGNWWVYDLDQKKYIDTTLPARGPEGKGPIVLANGNYGNWDEATQAYVDSGVKATTTVNLDIVPVEFTQTATRVTINSGETVPTMMGKIKKWFADFGSLAWKSSVNFSTEVTNKPTTVSGYGITDAGDMKKSVYDKDGDGIVDNASNSAKLEGKTIQNIVDEQVIPAIATHNAATDAHTDIRNHVNQVEAIARGKSRARVFDTVADLDSWLAVPANVAQLQVGDNFYIVQTDVPDYWWDGTQKQPLETEKVVLPTPLPKTAVLSVVGWVASHNTAMGEYQYTVTDTDITDGADIDISIADAASSDIAVAANLYNGISAAVGQFIIYCKTIPTGNININYRISWL